MFAQTAPHDSLPLVDSQTYTKVILIDEDEANYDPIKQHLNQSQLAAFALDWVSSRAAGLEAILSEQYDAALVTCSPNLRSCLDFIHHASQAQPHVPLIALINNDDPGTGRQTLTQGASDYLLFSQIGSQLLERSITGAIEHVCATTPPQATRAELEQHLVPPSVELAETPAKLTQEIAELDELDLFARTIGYTVRDPLSLIIGYTDLLKNQAALPDRLQAYLNAIAANGLKLGSIIDELQMLIGIRKATIESQPLNMVRIIAEVEQRLAYLIREHQAKITISEYWPLALGHKPWVEEVWANYLTNAIKYGGRPPRLFVGATALSGGQVRFWVRDNGPGLSPAEQTRVFTGFTGHFQDPITEQRLRLATVKSIVTKLGGYVGVESAGAPGHGSVFSFTLPQA